MKKTYLFILFTSFLLYITTLIFHFNILITPVVFLVLGALIRVFTRDKGRFILIFTFLIPIISGFAFFENNGMPLNYLMLPLLLLMGIFITDIFILRKKALLILEEINIHYLFFLIVVFVSFVFILLKWTNITSGFDQFLKDTPVSVTNIRVSFAVIFPLMYLFLFSSSLLYFCYLKKIKNKTTVLVLFLSGNTISVFLAFLQLNFNLKLFLGHSKPFVNGLASDASSFGFLVSLSFLFSAYLIKLRKKKGYFFLVVSMYGILISATRIGLISIALAGIYYFFTLKKKRKIIFMLILIILFVNGLYIFKSTAFKKKLIFINEIENTFWDSLKLLINKSEENTELKNISSGRKLLWDYSKKIVKQYPLIGVGAGNFVFFVMYDNYEKGFFHDLPGNQYLFFSSSIGLIGLIVFLMFLINVMRKKRGIELYILLCVLLISFFGNYMWIPECFLAFWLILSLGKEKQGIKVLKNKKYSFVIYGVIIVVFIISNIYHFNDLHPKTWAKNTGTNYDYGFWYKEKNKQGEDFKWTKNRAAQYIYLDKNGESRGIKLFCGAPLHKIKGKQQSVEIYWKGRLYKNIKFRENREVKFKIKDNPFEEGFLEIRVHPCFNLKRTNLSEESRDLGVQFF